MDDKTLSDSDIPEDPTSAQEQTSPTAAPESLHEAPEGEPSPSTEVNKASAEANEASANDEEADAAPEGTGREWKPVPIPRWARFPMSAQAGWVATLVTTLVAALIRLPGLGTIKTLVFDETYYVKDAYSLMTLGYEGSWAKDNDPMFIAGNYSGLSTNGGYVVHPSVGKWLISLGMRIRWHRDCSLANRSSGCIPGDVCRCRVPCGPERSGDLAPTFG